MSMRNGQAGDEYGVSNVASERVPVSDAKSVLMVRTRVIARYVSATTSNVPTPERRRSSRRKIASVRWIRPVLATGAAP